MADKRHGWKVDVHRRENGKIPIAASICDLHEPAKSQAIEFIFDCMTKNIELSRGKDILPKLPNSKALQDEGNLFESWKGQLRLFYTLLPGHRMILLDILEKKRGKLPPYVIKRLRQLQQEVLTMGKSSN